MQEEPPYLFAYGSLVNPNSWANCSGWHKNVDPKEVRPVTLEGWVREWRHNIPANSQKCMDRAVTALTIERDPKFQIDGVLIPINESILSELSDRECGYDLTEIEASAVKFHHSHRVLDAKFVYSFASGPDSRRWADIYSPIIQSYVDCIAEGYLNRFGKAGVQRFMKSTKGWELPIIDDRQIPLYPRHTEKSSKVYQVTDKQLGICRKNKRFRVSNNLAALVES